MGSLIACFPKNTLLLGQDHSHLGGKENRVECNLWRTSLGAQRVKNLPAMQETRVGYLGQEEGMATPSRILAWKIPWTEKPGRLQAMGSQSQTWLSDFTFTFHIYIPLKSPLVPIFRQLHFQLRQLLFSRGKKEMPLPTCQMNGIICLFFFFFFCLGYCFYGSFSCNMSLWLAPFFVE